MFNFFRRKKKIHLKGWENDLFLNIFKELGDEYLYYEKPIREGIIEGVRYNPKMPDHINFILNVTLLNRYEKKKEAFRTVSGVKVFDEKTLEFKDIEIDLGYGLVLGYCTEDILNFNPDVTKIKIGIIKKRYPDNNDFDEISFLFSKKEKELLNISMYIKLNLKAKRIIISKI